MLETSMLQTANQPIVQPGYLKLPAKRVRTCRFEFAYQFASGEWLWGIVEGDILVNAPKRVFNLKNLQATLEDRRQRVVLSFDTVYGQFRLDQPEALFSGSHSQSGSFFCINYRAGEAAVFDAVQGCWLASGWHPKTWKATMLGTVKEVPLHAAFSPAAVPRISPTTAFASTVAFAMLH
jgi:hypothetical protein